MRPIERGAAPRAYARYADAIGDLENRLGRYSSYCERRLPTSLAVEHVAPKSLHRNRERDWGNFLLGCANCNSIKGNQDVAEDDVLWPDRHNTMRRRGQPRRFVATGSSRSTDPRRPAVSSLTLPSTAASLASGLPSSRGMSTSGWS